MLWDQMKLLIKKSNEKKTKSVTLKNSSYIYERDVGKQLTPRYSVRGVRGAKAKCCLRGSREHVQM